MLVDCVVVLYAVLPNMFSSLSPLRYYCSTTLWLSSADLLAHLPAGEPVGVSGAPAVGEPLARVGRRVEVPAGEGAAAATAVGRQRARRRVH